MPEFTYLIVGGGMAADSAARGIRTVDAKGSIAIITSESNPPYNRPPLSKALWKGEPIDNIWRSTPESNVTIRLRRTVVSLDVKSKTVADDEGISHSFQKLLLATGGSVRRLPWDVDGIIYFRTLEDYRALRKLTETGKSFVVIGGGFIGSEIAAALAINGKSVTMIVPEDGIGARVYPPRLSHFLTEYYRSKSVTIMNKDGVENVRKDGRTYLVRTKSGTEIRADGVVAGIGIEPNISLAKSAGIQVDNGIVVDEYLQTSHPDVFAAGDVASFYSAALNKRIRVEHEDNANTMGEMAGKNMAGQRIAYRHLPFFYSDLFDLGYEAVGELDARYEIVEDWKEEFREGVVYYLEAGRVRGVLLWNTWGQVDNARALIAEQGPWNKGNITGRLPA